MKADDQHRDKTVPLPRASGGDDAPTVVDRKEAGARPAEAAPREEATHLRVFEMLGQGGMGTVHRAEQLELERPVAFKQLRATGDEVLRERFVREARITAQLDHPNIVPVYVLETSQSGKAIGYAMKLVEGKTFRDLLVEAAAAHTRGGPVDAAHSLPTLLEHFLKICDAIAFAHDRGILHRDLKPANIMVGRFGEVYVMDWGIARPIGSPTEARAKGAQAHSVDPELTRDGDIVGSAAYMAPEQAMLASNELDPRADQFALGLLLFEIVSLRRARDTSTGAAIFTEAVRGVKAPLEHVSRRERIAPELRAIVEKATAVDRANRYPTVDALAEDVRRFMRGDAVVARPENVLGKVLRAMSKHRRATLGVVLGALAIAAVAVSWINVKKTEGELRARRRGELETALYIDVAAQGHRIDSQFQRMEESLEGLGAAAEWALSGPSRSEVKYFLDTDYADAARRPGDFTKETTYRWPVSVDDAVIGIAPGTDRAAVKPKLDQLAPLRSNLVQAVLGAAVSEGGALPTGEAKRRILLQRLGPIDYAYVDTPEGIHMVWPGVDALPPGYDVRTSGFYTMSDHQHGKRWGSPYVDSTTDELGDDLVLPCTEGLWSPKGDFLGVAGVEITVTKMVETSLALPNRKTQRVSLVNGEGKKVIDSGDAGKRFTASGKDEGLELFDFDVPVVVEAIRAGKEGLREVDRKGRRFLVAFVRLDVLGWYYVVEVDAATIEAAG